MAKPEQIEVQAVINVNQLNMRPGDRAVVERTEQVDRWIARGRLAVVVAEKPAKKSDDTTPEPADQGD